jgi:anti-sigma B factor antagonist
MDALEITVATTGTVVAIGLAGELEPATVSLLNDAVDQAVAPGATIVIDMRDITYLDSGGIGALNRCHRHALANGATVTVAFREGGPVDELITWTGLDAVLDIRRVPAA